MAVRSGWPGRLRGRPVGSGRCRCGSGRRRQRSGVGRRGGHWDADGGESTGTADDEGTVATAGRDDEDDPVEIVADQRELDSNIARDLSTRDGIETRLETLAVGDYVLSDRVVVERKTVADFMDTLTGGDRSMFEQVGDATRHYGRPVVIIEGEDLFGARNVHHGRFGRPRVAAVDFGASVLRTSDEDETADLRTPSPGASRRPPTAR